VLSPSPIWRHRRAFLWQCDRPRPIWRQRAPSRISNDDASSRIAFPVPLGTRPYGGPKCAQSELAQPAAARPKDCNRGCARTNAHRLSSPAEAAANRSALFELVRVHLRSSAVCLACVRCRVRNRADLFYAAFVTFQNSGIPFTSPFSDFECAVGWKYSPSGR
jgi:hypothetical protein